MKNIVQNSRHINKLLSLKSSAGFTLIESLAAIFILTVGITAVLQSFPAGVVIQKTAQINTIANQLCQEKMEEIISRSYEEMVPGSFEESYGTLPLFPSFKRAIEIGYYDPNNPGVVPATDLGIKKIRVTVYWQQNLGTSERSVAVSNLYAKR